jgi:hypothetical protein
LDQVLLAATTQIYTNDLQLELVRLALEDQLIHLAAVAAVKTAAAAGVPVMLLPMVLV